ncbi:tetratricopeptide repeat protein [Reichenbachiella versicolor]|uniref:tetratricopeptide repeat protein n=1 Tax=Reichenbachiella versicolor TaxID=1821036 RepID=UPI0013A5507E|nr:tetratricopeptide repeat protein [Reichenbachiella versicolor]
MCCKVRLHILLIFATLLACSLKSWASTSYSFDTTVYLKKRYVDYGFFLSRRNNLEGQQFFINGAEFFLDKGDTASYLRCRIELSDLKRRAGDFNGAFDVLSEIEHDAIRSTDYMVQMKLLIKYGVMYGVFGQDSLSLSYLQKCLDIAKSKGRPKDLLQPHLSIAQQYISMNEYDFALKHLDSCYLLSPNTKRLHYVDCYYGHIYLSKGDTYKAKIYLRDLVKHFEKNKPAFIVLVYDYMGDLKNALNETDSAVYFWNQSIEAIDTLNAYKERKPRVLEKLAFTYSQHGQYKTALEYMSMSKRISDTLFTTQSKQNKELFEIKSKFKRTLSRKDIQIAAQQNLIEEQDKQSFRLQLIIGILILVSTIVFVFYRLRIKMRQMILEQEKKDEVLEIKTKELTVNTLQLIEKEKSINELLELVKEKAPELYVSIRNRTRQNDQKIWEDFHRRFTQTNTTFYDKLLKTHPSLTQNDLKHCALIKLKFDSKEMSHILGISVHSVHMSRSRIRKKMGMERAESLSNYLEKI